MVSLTINKNGLLTLKVVKSVNQTDSDGNGIFESREVTEITYHAAGSISEHTQANEQFSDSTGDLVSFYSATTNYDTQGNVVYERVPPQMALMVKYTLQHNVHI